MISHTKSISDNFDNTSNTRIEMIANMPNRRPWAIVGLVAIAGLAIALFVSLGLALAAHPESPFCKDVANTGIKQKLEGGTIFVSGTHGPDEIDCTDAHFRVEVHGGRGADIITGSMWGDILSGGNEKNAPGDILNGGPGNDILRGGWGHDTLNGDGGDDELSGGQNDDMLDGGDGDDDTCKGGKGDDTEVNFPDCEHTSQIEN